MDFIKNLPISLFDLLMIVIGVFSILFGLIGKAPRKIFRLVFIIISLVAAYFVNKYVGPIVLEALEPVIGDTLATVKEKLGEELYTVLLDTILYWIFGLVCLIVIPLIGNLIVKIATHKSKKGTAKWTFGIPSLLSTAIVWVFILLPLIVLKPILTEKNIDAIREVATAFMTESNDSSTDQGGTQTASAKTESSNVIPLGSHVALLGDSADESTNNDPLAILDNEYVKLAIDTFANSKFLTFTAEQGVPFVEKTVSTVSGKHFEFFAVEDSTGNKVGLMNSLKKTVDAVVESKDVIVQAAALTKNKNMEVKDILPLLLTIKPDTLKDLLNGLGGTGNALSGLIQELVEDKMPGVDVKQAINALTSEENVNLLVKIITSDTGVLKLMSAAMGQGADLKTAAMSLMNPVGADDTAKAANLATKKAAVKDVLVLVGNLASQIDGLPQIIKSVKKNLEIGGLLNVLNETNIDKLLNIAYDTKTLTLVGTFVQGGKEAGMTALLKAENTPYVENILTTVVGIVAGVEGIDTIVNSLTKTTYGSFIPLLAVDGVISNVVKVAWGYNTAAENADPVYVASPVLNIIGAKLAGQEIQPMTVVSSLLSDATVVAAILDPIKALVATVDGALQQSTNNQMNVALLVNTLAKNDKYGTLVQMLGTKEMDYLKIALQVINIQAIMGVAQGGELDVASLVNSSFFVKTVKVNEVDTVVPDTDHITAFVQFSVESNILATAFGLVDQFASFAGLLPMIPTVVASSNDAIASAMRTSVDYFITSHTNDEDTTILNKYKQLKAAIAEDSVVTTIVESFTDPEAELDTTEVIGGLFNGSKEDIIANIETITSVVESLPSSMTESLGDMGGIIDALSNPTEVENIASIGAVIDIAELMSDEPDSGSLIKEGAFTGENAVENAANLVKAITTSDLVSNLSSFIEVPDAMGGSIAGAATGLVAQVASSIGESLAGENATTEEIQEAKNEFLVSVFDTLDVQGTEAEDLTAFKTMLGLDDATIAAVRAAKQSND